MIAFFLMNVSQNSFLNIDIANQSTGTLCDAALNLLLPDSLGIPPGMRSTKHLKNCGRKGISVQSPPLLSWVSGQFPCQIKIPEKNSNSLQKLESAGRIQS